MFQTVIFGSYSSNFRFSHWLDIQCFFAEAQKVQVNMLLVNGGKRHFVRRCLHEFLTVLGSCHIEKSPVRDVLGPKETGIRFQHGQAIESRYLVLVEK